MTEAFEILRRGDGQAVTPSFFGGGPLSREDHGQGLLDGRTTERVLDVVSPAILLFV